MVFGNRSDEAAGWRRSTSVINPSYVLRFAELSAITRNRFWTSFWATACRLDFGIPERVMLTENIFAVSVIKSILRFWWF